MRKTLLLLSLALPACSSGGDPGSTPQPTCTVSCPAGAYCDGDRCLPICAPPCGPGEYCGTDNVCHPGTAPDGNVVPHLDGGPPKKDGAVTDSVAKPDTVDPNKALCDCVAQQPKAAYCAKQAVTCQSAADCCTPGSTIPCGTYGNTFTCSAGKCVRAGCSSKSECVSYAQLLQQAEAASWDCHAPVCPGIPDYCGLIKSCVTASDCCVAGTVPCGLYTNHYSCDSGTCAFQGCLSDAECVSYAQAIGVPDPSTYVCQKAACGNTGYCVVKPKPCSQPTDCCAAGSTLPCGVYGNRYRCESGGCVLDSCTGYQDCQSYAAALQLPEASQYNCVVY